MARDKADRYKNHGEGEKRRSLKRILPESNNLRRRKGIKEDQDLVDVLEEHE